MFDVAELASLLANWPMLQIPVLLVMVVVVGILPGFAGYRWHAAHLRAEHFEHKCTIVADGRRQALKAANDDSFITEIRIASMYLAAMRDAMTALGANPEKINPLNPVDLVIDHSVSVDAHGSAGAFGRNVDLEMQRNRERYTFLRWGQRALGNFRVVPPGTGICHQVNLEYLARVVWEDNGLAYPDTLVGTDSHTTMVNGLGVFGWGVGGIEAEAVMLGQPLAMLIPDVVGFELTGHLPSGATATDLVLTEGSGAVRL